ncbi:MAG: hypothetical protein LKI21_01055 [Bifidobacterium crudilactis]|jgi:flagellar basal body-associated protein FliL|nr:hypothetical protein [Bifidobacterium crudilactis]
MKILKILIRTVLIALVAVVLTGAIAVGILWIASSFFGKQLSVGQAFAWLAVVSAFLECLAFALRTATEPQKTAENRKRYAQYVEFLAVAYLAASAIGIAMTL